MSETIESVAPTESEVTAQENAGSTPLPAEQEQQQAASAEQNAAGEEADTVKEGEITQDEIPRPGHTAPMAVPPGTVENSQYPSGGQQGGGYREGNPRVSLEASNQNLPLTINQLAIVASAQNKLPVSKVKGIVLRLGRHTEASAMKSGGWYKNENYVDKNSYSWKNMPLFDDYQRHLWTPEGTVRSSCKK